jgi:hypothetical protein
MIKECGNNYKHMSSEQEREKIFGVETAKKLRRRRNQTHTNHHSRPFPSVIFSNIAFFLPYPLHMKFFSLFLALTYSLARSLSLTHCKEGELSDASVISLRSLFIIIIIIRRTEKQKKIFQLNLHKLCDSETEKRKKKVIEENFLIFFFKCV